MVVNDLWSSNYIMAQPSNCESSVQLNESVVRYLTPNNIFDMILMIFFLFILFDQHNNSLTYSRLAKLC